MKFKLLLLSFLLSATLGWGQGNETFTNLNAPTGAYGNGSYTGDNGVVWTYSEARSVDATDNITGRSIGLRDTGTRFIRANSGANGVGDLTYTISSYFTGGTASNRTVEIYVNSILKETFTLPAMTTDYTRTVSANESGNVLIEFRSTGTRQIVLDNISWTSNNICATPNPTGTITATQNCGNTSLTYSAPSASLYWQTSATGTSTANATTAPYAVSSNGTYYVRAFNGTCWSTGTVSQAVTVVNPITISSQPTSQSATTGNTATFSVTASNAAGYQWQVNTGSGWANIGGATSASYTTPAATLAMNGYQYQVIVTGNTPCGNVTSSAATLSVTTGPCLSENFNSNTLPAGWAQNGGTTFTGGEGVFGANNCELATIIVAYPSSLTFDLRRTNNNSAKTFYVEVSTTTQSGTYTTIATYDHSNTTSAGTTSCTVDLSAYSSFPSVYIKFRKVSSTTSPWYLDNMSVFCAAPPSGPEINVTGNGTNIADNDTTPAAIDGTNLGTVALSTNIVQTFTIENAGTTDLILSGPITLTDVSVPQEFTITQPATNTIPSGGSVNFTVTFNSAVAGTFTNTINIGSNDTDEALYNFDIIATAYDVTATGTLFRPGDLIFVGYDSTVSAAADCSGGAQMDKLYVANLVDILPGTVFMVVNSRYESGAAANVRTDRWYSGSTDPYDDPGIITFKWNGVAPIVAGSIITFKANVFTVSDIRINDVVTTDFGVTTNANQCNISSTESDQIYIMQGTFTSFGTIGTNRYNLFNGNVLFGLTNGANWVPFTSGVSAANSSAGRVSRLPEDLECFNIESSSLEGVRFYRNSGLHTGSKNQILGAIMNLGNWSAPSNDNCLSTTENFSPSANDNAVGKPFTITPSNPDGTWTGFTDTDWFKCSNWEGLAVPKPITDVIIPNVVNQPIIGASPAKFPTGAFSKNLTVNNGSSLTMNTAASRLNLYGNWTNDAGNNAFTEGNGTVHFNGTTPQIINNVTPVGTEVFYNVVLNNNFDTATSNDLIASGDLTVATGKTLNIDANGFAQVNKKLTHNGTITVQNDGQFIQIDETDTNTGTYTGTQFQVKRNADNIRSLDYVYWSAPVENTDVASINGTLRYYWDTTAANPNGTQGYWLAATGTMNKGQGYIVRGPSSFSTPQTLSVDFNGKPFNGQFNYPITRGTNGTSKDDNLILVGNPYASAIDADAFLAANPNIEGAVRIWTHGTLPSSAITSPFYENFAVNYTANDYIVYNATATTVPGAFDGKIASGQGFFITMLEAGAAAQNITFRNAMRGNAITGGTLDNTQFFKNTAANVQQGSIEKNRIWLDLISANGEISKTVVGYVAGATMEKDNRYDAYAKLNYGMTFYSLVGEEAIHIQGRALPFDDADVVPMGMQLVSAGNYTVALAHLDGLFAGNQDIYLEDRLLNIVHNLKDSPYSFTADAAGFVNNRFVLRYKNASLSNDDFETAANTVTAYGNGGVVVKSTTAAIKEVVVYDVLGRTIAQKKNVASNEVVLPSVRQTQSALIVKITLENGQVIDKKILY